MQGVGAALFARLPGGGWFLRWFVSESIGVYSQDGWL